MPAEDRPTVLVAEDERPLAEMYAEYLSAEYDVRVAYDGEEAVELVDADVDVALLDRRMPRKTGDEVLEHIEAEGYDLGLAMVTAVDPDLDIVGMGFDDYICKPVSEEDLLELVERLLDRREYDATVRELASCLRQRSLLDEELGDGGIADSEEFARLQDRIDRLEREADELLASMDRDDVEGLFRQLDAAVGDDLAEPQSGDG